MRITIEIADDGTAEVENIGPVLNQGQTVQVRSLSHMQVADIVDAGSAPASDDEIAGELAVVEDGPAEVVEMVEDPGGDFDAGAGPG
jgi:hypothetical protein